MIDTSEAVWCGDRNGGYRCSPPTGSGLRRGGVHGRHLERLVAGERGQDRGQALAPASSCPRRAGRPAGGGDRRRPRPRARAGRRAARGPATGRGRCGPGSPGRQVGRAGPRTVAVERGDELGEVRHRTDDMPTDEAPPRRRWPRARTTSSAVDRRAHRQDAGDRPDRAVEAELAEHRQPRQRRDAVVAQLAARGEHPDRDREIETGAELAESGRRQVDRDSSIRPDQPRGQHGRPDTVAALATRGVGQADDGVARQTRRRRVPRR